MSAIRPWCIYHDISNDFDVTAIPFDVEGPGLTAILGGEADFMPSGVSAAARQIKTGNMQGFAIVNAEEADIPSGGPAITNDIPEMEKFLPWGPFYGVFVRRDVSEDVIATLVSAYSETAQNPDFNTRMAGRENIVVNFTGEEADNFLTKWQQVTTWVLQVTGAAKVRPEDLGIARPYTAC
ncbi:MAG: hypothetical protein ABJU46_19405 [Paracoccaceae bacterium]